MIVGLEANLAGSFVVITRPESLFTNFTFEMFVTSSSKLVSQSTPT